MLGIDEPLVNGETPPIVDLALHLVLALHRMLLPLDVVGIEARRDEELGKAVEGLGKLPAVYVEVVGRPIIGGVGIGVPPMPGYELAESVHLGVLVRGDEQHVFDEVRESRMVVGVVVAAPRNAHRRSGRSAVGNVDQECAKAVRQHDVAVVVLVVGTLDRLERHAGAGGQEDERHGKDTVRDAPLLHGLCSELTV